MAEFLERRIEAIKDRVITLRAVKACSQCPWAYQSAIDDCKAEITKLERELMLLKGEGNG